MRMSTSVSSNDMKGFVELSKEDERKMIDYEPLPYAFRIPDKLNKIGETPILSPPQWLLLDHTIAVIWSLFTTFAPGKALDIEDLKWAREFLKDIRNAKGDRPPDVKTCLTEIENRLIALYAQLTHRKESKVNVVTSDEEKLREQNEKSPEPERKEQSEKRDNKICIKETVKSDSTCGWKMSKVPQTSGILKKSSFQDKKTELIRRDNKKEEEKLFGEVLQRSRTNEMISGIQNYAKKKDTKPEEGLNHESSEEVMKISKGDISQIRIDDPKTFLEFEKRMPDYEINNEQAYRNLKNEILNVIKNPKIPKREVLNFLKKWREEQVERFQIELRRLNSIEEFMKSIKVEGYVPYLPKELTMKLESIACKNKKNKPS